jgi:hypothetical protein
MEHLLAARKLGVMGRQGVTVFTRHLRYRKETFECPSCHAQHTRDSAEEKGVDVRIALDVLTLASRNAFDVGLIFSQDQVLSEVADEVRLIARQAGRWIKLASTFPQTTRNPRGINRTDWLPFDKTLSTTGASTGATIESRKRRTLVRRTCVPGSKLGPHSSVVGRPRNLWWRKTRSTLRLSRSHDVELFELRHRDDTAHRRRSTSRRLRHGQRRPDEDGARLAFVPHSEPTPKERPGCPVVMRSSTSTTRARRVHGRLDEERALLG